MATTTRPTSRKRPLLGSLQVRDAIDEIAATLRTVPIGASFAFGDDRARSIDIGGIVYPDQKGYDPRALRERMDYSPNDEATDDELRAGWARVEEFDLAAEEVREALEQAREQLNDGQTETAIETLRAAGAKWVDFLDAECSLACDVAREHFELLGLGEGASA
ncbi:lysozyme inhibitor LprI family protein [Engelhardtia mirabilis]|uniref:Lysozyme inhibitor LprI-like N-terminal domain-containing protein n=1 Tax=Engelhardtia mirabilis TaxID=2528011 RepID=A0A518BL09_9BACT|nr:hypothetical protein Pla133_27520 [Planctomycetes bacterium Pla133]QDV01990.1 hypothetical protein Pla86_27510 [Planctomycetes bacterium Pla86]